MISYDRIFEHLNLATEMISGKPKDFTLFSSLWNIYKRKENQMGNIYVKYLTPIKLEAFVQKNFPEGIKTPELFKKAAIELTECLLKVQEEQTPVNLNSIIAACILQKNSDKIHMTQLLKKATHIYDYMKTKKYVETYMQVNPQQTLVELHVEGMGFNMENRGKKNCVINLKGIHESEVSMLGLAFYSMRLSSIF